MIRIPTLPNTNDLNDPGVMCPLCPLSSTHRRIPRFPCPDALRSIPECPLLDVLLSSTASYEPLHLV